MTHMHIFLFILGGMVALYVGAELLVLFASKLALSLGLTHLMTGLTIVAFCTSTPELVSSLIALLKNNAPNMALGNVIGSNIANIGLILGALAIIRPIHVPKAVIKVEAPLGLMLVVMLWLMMLSGYMHRFFGVFLLVCLAGYFFWHFYLARKKHEEPDHPLMQLSFIHKVGFFSLVILGALITIVGGFFFIEGAAALAEQAHLSSRWVGLTLVAVGSSLPEFAASFIALMRKNPSLAIGNIFGSNILNILLVLGVMITLSPFTFSKQFLIRDLPALLAFSFLTWFFALKKGRIGRVKGLCLFVGYLAYIVLWA